MALPAKISVKISSEAAGYVSFTPVARRELDFGELVERILGVTGKKPARVHDILSRGTFVSGSSRYRWEPFDAPSAELHAFLDTFPDEEPDRPFNAARCAMVVFQGRRGNLELAPEVAAKRRLFKKQSFWDVLMSTLEAAQPEYQRYSYTDRADVYQVRLSPGTIQTLGNHTKLLKYAAVAQQFHFLEPDTAELLVPR